MGLTLFDIRLAPDGKESSVLHPSLRRVPGFSHNLVLCLLRICGKLYDISALGTLADYAPQAARLPVTRLSLERPWPQTVEYSEPDFDVVIKLVEYPSGLPGSTP
jgi:hypothetical protein